MINSPYTRWTGDELHGHTRVFTHVWVRLDVICAHSTDMPSRVIETGLDMTGEVPGRLHGWFPTVKADWLGVVDYEIPYADPHLAKLALKDQLVPSYALRKREDAPRQ